MCGQGTSHLVCGLLFISQFHILTAPCAETAPLCRLGASPPSPLPLARERRWSAWSFARWATRLRAVSLELRPPASCDMTQMLGEGHVATERVALRRALGNVPRHVYAQRHDTRPSSTTVYTSSQNSEILIVIARCRGQAARRTAEQHKLGSGWGTAGYWQHARSRAGRLDHTIHVRLRCLLVRTVVLGVQLAAVQYQQSSV